MTIREFYLRRREAESPAFMKVLKALPRERLSYKPDDRSPSAEQLVWTLTSELKACLDVIAEGQAAAKPVAPPPIDEMLEMYERWSKQLSESVSRMDEAAWERPVRIYAGGEVVLEQPAGEFLWLILFDAIHHRGQLTAYLRPMGGKVPAVYGPSADESPQ